MSPRLWLKISDRTETPKKSSALNAGQLRLCGEVRLSARNAASGKDAAIEGRRGIAILPLKDDIPSQRFPFVTYALIAANVVVFLFEVTMSQEQLQAFFELVAVIPAEYTAFARGEPVPLLKLMFAPFASMFLHGGWMHLFGNMWFLYLFGDNVEDAMGHFRFLLFYLLSGLAATFAHVAVNPLSPIPIVGASGAISGVVGAYFVMFPTARVLTLVPVFFFVDIVVLPALVFIGLWFLFQFWSGVLSLAVPHMGGVAWWAHIGGFIAGIVLAPIMRERRRPTRYRVRIYRYW